MQESGTGAQIKEIVARQREYFHSGETLDVAFRKRQLKKLYSAVRGNEDAISKALKEDLNKSPFEAYASEIGLVREELRFFLRKLTRFARPERVGTPITHFPSRSRIHKEPYGNVLIMSPWNYPFQLTLVPFIGAVAAGNTAVVKPSNYAPATAGIISEILSECFPEEYVAVLKGGRETNKELLDQKFDYIFFTGGETVGRIVMEAAARNLTPLSLELGGKSPCIVDGSAKIDLAAKRIAWGKLLNSGQTCVAPDYILAEKGIAGELLERLKHHMDSLFGPKAETHPDFPKIISKKHFDRLSGLIESSSVYHGGRVNEETLQISPTIVHPVSEEDGVMQEEIFGPILPVITYGSLDEAVAFIKNRPSPLALYLFTESKEAEKRLVQDVPFGGGCVNDTVVHLATPNMPFGGIGASGMGAYHGKNSFDTFTHRKSILKKSTRLDVPIRYAPYGKKLGLLKKVMK